MASKGADPEPSAFIKTQAIDNLKPEPEVKEAGSEVVAELAPLREDIFSRPTKVEELSIETLVDLLVESTIELVSSLTVMRATLFLRSPDVYNSLQIFPPADSFTGDWYLGMWIDFSGAELIYYTACILFELPSTVICLSWKLFYLHYIGLDVTR